MEVQKSKTLKQESNMFVFVLQKDSFAASD